MSFAFVDSTSGAIHSLYTAFDNAPTSPTFVTEPIRIEEPDTPDGCVRVPITSSIVTTDAILAVPIAEAPGFIIVDDEDKLADLRARALPHIRETRNQLMAMCDWRVMPDSPLTAEKRAEWTAYRQALRDLPSTTELVRPVWPTMPSP
jgi:hypothetical protein